MHGLSPDSGISWILEGHTPWKQDLAHIGQELKGQFPALELSVW